MCFSVILKKTLANHIKSIKNLRDSMLRLETCKYNTSIIFLLVSFLLCILSLILFSQVEFYPLIFKSNKKSKIPEKMFNSVSPSYLESIVSANLHLIEIRPSNSKNIHNRTCYNVEAVFCKLNWSLYKLDPSGIPMFRMLVQKSNQCKQTYVTVTNFCNLVQLIKRNDIDNSKIRINLLTGFVFHESRCGSTLIANLLASFQPQHNRVYSEASPVLTAVQMKNIQLLQDVIYVLSRTNDPYETHVFYKIQSVGSTNIPIFREAFPNVPFIFLYRDPIQVLMSHLDISSSNKPLKARISNRKNVSYAVCLRSKYNPSDEFQQLLKQKIKNKPLREDIHSISNENICAAHLATICQTAFSQIRKSGGSGLLINYKTLPYVVTKKIIPHFLESPSKKIISSIDDLGWNWNQLKKMEETYSKAGRNKMNNGWNEDTVKKEQNSWKELRNASHIFLEPIYQQMENYRLSRLH